MKLDWKLVSAFGAGAVLACGIVYFSVKPAVIAPEAVRRPAPAPKTRTVTSLPVARAKVPTAPLLAPPVEVPIREKPSPMPPPVRHDKPAIARYEPLPAPASKPVENVPAENVSLPAQPPVQPKVETHVAPTVTLTSGTVLAVRLAQTLSSARNQPGDSFVAILTQPLVVGEWVIAERGARAEGRVVEIAQSAQGAAQMQVSIDRVALSDGQTLRVRTEPYAATVSNGIFFRKAAEIPEESRLTFRVLDPITVTERVSQYARRDAAP